MSAQTERTRESLLAKRLRQGGAKVRAAMFIKLIAASFLNRRSRMMVILLSVTIGAAVVSGLSSIYGNLDTNFGRELRGYGANVVVLPANAGLALDTKATDKVAARFGDRLVGYTPVIYAKVTLGRSEVVLVGLRLNELKKLSPYLKTTRNKKVKSGSGVLVGSSLADKLGLKTGNRHVLTSGRNKAPVTIAGRVVSGGVEENQIFTELKVAQRLLRKPDQAALAYLSVIGNGGNPANAAEKFGRRYGLRVEAITGISQNETRVLSRIKALVFFVAGIILITGVLSVATTMMTMVIERRREVALKKALGADNLGILAEFAGEGIVIGLIGGLLGWGFGFAFAQWAGEKIFRAHIPFSPATVLVSVGVSLAVAVLALMVPVRMAVDVEPAVVLKGE